MRALVGIFVGGKSRRMGGIAKGLLAAPDTGEPIVTRLARIAREALPESEVVLVGITDAYAVTGIPALADAPSKQGPLAGLCALLEEAKRRDALALALACDMPRVSPQLVTRLIEHAPEALAVAPRPGGIWQPLFARYAPEPALEAAARVQAPYQVLAALNASELPLSDEELSLLADWDSPEDVG